MASMELTPKLVNDAMVAIRPGLSMVHRDGYDLSTLKRDMSRLQKELGANAQEREIFERIIKAVETAGQSGALSKLLSPINDQAQKANNVGISVKLLSETVRAVVEQAEEEKPDPSAVEPMARMTNSQRYVYICAGTVAGFAAGGVIGGIGIGLVTAWASAQPD